jgi:site-specific recombinase XerD
VSTIPVETAITRFLAHRRARGRKAETLTQYSQQLEHWRDWRREEGQGLLLSDVTIDELRGFIAFLMDEARPRTKLRRARKSGEEGMSPRTVFAYYRTLRGLWNYLSAEVDDNGVPLLTAAQMTFFRNNRIAVPRPSERERAAIVEVDVERLVAAAGSGDDEESARNRAILWMLFESGLRVRELASITDFDVDLGRRMARIVGKGDKEAVVFWGPRTQLELLRYLKLRRGPRRGPLFRGVSSRNQGGPVSSNLVRLLIKRLARDARIELPQGSPVHWFRHGFARECRRRGLSRQEVQDLLRHDNPVMTRVYLGLDAEALGKTHRKVWGERGRV